MSTILFVGVGNASRSQLAEAIARHLAPDIDVWSAGTAPSHVCPQVGQVLDEVGVDAWGLRGKALNEVPLEEVDVAVLVDAAAQAPLLPPRIRQVRWPLPDPSAAPPYDALEAFRATRDELLRRLPALLDELRAL